MSGQIRISKLYLAVLYSQKPRSTSPPVIFQTVSRRVLLGNSKTRRERVLGMHSSCLDGIMVLVSLYRVGGRRKGESPCH